MTVARVNPDFSTEDLPQIITFVGLPGSGKTTISKLVAADLARPWFDSDQEIEKLAGKAISAIFAAHGEPHFRLLESQCLARLLALDELSPIISLGGGSILQNSPLIKEKSQVIYLFRSLDDIINSVDMADRPLLAGRTLAQTKEALAKTFRVRHPLYEELADMTIVNQGPIQSVVEKAVQAINENFSN